VNAIIHPLSLIGPCITIRKFSKDPFKVQDLINFGTLTKNVAEFLRICVTLKKNIIVSGGTGSGKTTLLNVLSSYLPDDERILTIEDAAELRLTQDHIIRLEARPANIEGRGAVTIRDLVKNALRMRPDRIVVGECRGSEALDMLQAMNTGHEGSLTTIHANTPRDALARLETMVLMAGMELPVKAIREQVGSAVHMICQISRFSDGSRKVSKITEVSGMEGDRLTLQDIFEFKQTGLDDNGKVLGETLPTGAVPTFIEEITVRGIPFDRSIFETQHVAGKWR
jgi:pilus assembly protein CpaF